MKSNPKAEDLTDKQFGWWHVLGFSRYSRMPSNKRMTYWVCRCVCGVERDVQGRSLRSGKSVSCGCYARKASRDWHSLPKGESALNQLYRRYEDGAKKRGLLFNLDKTQVKELSQKPCNYCGYPPHQKVWADPNLKNYKYNGGFVYNGIDRIDNTKGYLLDNVVPCCGVCNRMKMTMSVDEFLEQIGRITAHRSNY